MKLLMKPRMTSAPPSAAFLLLAGLLFFVGLLDGRWALAEQPEEEEDANPCDWGNPDALSDVYGKNIPETCISVPYDDGTSTVALERCYYSYIPDSCYQDGAPKEIPLVVDNHGNTGCPLFHAGYSGWMEKAEEECFAVMWPSGNYDSKFIFGSCFNVPGFLRSEDWGTNVPNANNVTTMPCCCFEGLGIPDTEPNDPLFLKLAIETMVESSTAGAENEITIDADRVYMAGHSNGCFASLAMAALYSDTIAAVCCHAGGVLTPFPSDYTPVPIWMVHGTNDRVVPYEGNTMLNYPGVGAVGFWSMDDTMEYLSTQNGCSENGGVDFSESGADGRVLTRSNCKNDATVEVLELTNVGHFPYYAKPEWEEFAFSENGGFLVPFDTTAMAWDFCSSYSRGGSTTTTTAPIHEQDEDIDDETDGGTEIDDDDAGPVPEPESEPEVDGGDESEADSALAESSAPTRIGMEVALLLACGIIAVSTILEATVL
jgi:polyhydroxybutyrate depolymerase